MQKLKHDFKNIIRELFIKDICFVRLKILQGCYAYRLGVHSPSQMHPFGQLLIRYRHREIQTFSRDVTGHEILSLILRVGLKMKDKTIFFTEFQRKKNQRGC